MCGLGLTERRRWPPDEKQSRSRACHLPEPFDQEHPIAFNVMEDIGKDQRPLVASGLLGSICGIPEM